MAKRKQQMDEAKIDAKAREGLTAEEWETAYIKLAKDVKNMEKVGKEIMRLAGKMF